MLGLASEWRFESFERFERWDTESLIVAVQNQSIRTNLVKAKIDKSQDILYVEYIEM